jgi:hypothetical protein
LGDVTLRTAQVNLPHNTEFSLIVSKAAYSIKWTSHEQLREELRQVELAQMIIRQDQQIYRELAEEYDVEKRKKQLQHGKNNSQPPPEVQKGQRGASSSPSPTGGQASRTAGPKKRFVLLFFCITVERFLFFCEPPEVPLPFSLFFF